MANFVQNSSFTGLQTYTVNIPTTDQYSITGTLTLPNSLGTATQGAGGGAGTGTGAPPPSPSQVVVTIKQNGSTIYTTPAGSQGFSLPAIQCTAADVITFTLSSSLGTDQQLNTIRMTLSVSEGAI